jgi:phenylacetate-CoA ligase
VYNKGIVRKFQVIQKGYDYIVIKLVLLDNQKFNELKPELTGSIRKVMGPGCKVEFEYVDDIPPAKSGKYLYTISEL